MKSALTPVKLRAHITAAKAAGAHAMEIRETAEGLAVRVHLAPTGSQAKDNPADAALRDWEHRKGNG